MKRQKNLVDLVKRVEYSHVAGPPPAEVSVTHVTSDSRTVSSGSLFIALAGEKLDGHSYVNTILSQENSGVVVEREKIDPAWLVESRCCILTVKNSREVYGVIASTYFDFPQNSLNFIGITGTNGKTTVTYLLEKVLTDSGTQVGVIGTVNYRYTDGDGCLQIHDAPFTTPEPLILQETLREMADAGVETVLMEVSSHALDQKRLGNIEYDIAVFTNLSHDHLDYHHSMSHYFEAKTGLFVNHLKKDGKAVITYRESDGSMDNRWPDALATLLDERKIPYLACGRGEKSSIQPFNVQAKIDQTEMSFITPGGEVSLVSPLVGRFNVDNIMTTLGIAEVMGLDLQHAVGSLAETAGAPGRLERVGLPGDETLRAAVFVDYAHTPDALLNVLSTLKVLPRGRLICVFGCGGDRDVSKRPEMGKIVASHVDIAIVTDDNPRTESSIKIISQVMDGVIEAGMEERSVQWLCQSGNENGCVVIADRSEAIHRAVTCAEEDDVVLIAGKGHERYQLTNSGRKFFDDSHEVREAMVSWDLDSVADALGVDIPPWGSNRNFCGISTDSRLVGNDQLFIALQGDVYDGHDFLEKAVAAGAGGLVVSEDIDKKISARLPVYRVDDTLRALGDLAAYRRRRLASISEPLVVGITGSSGKTTVKEMVSSIFEKWLPDGDRAPTGRVLKTKGNFNNLIGLPLSLVPLQLKHRVAVLEMGMNQPGEIKRLAAIADPDISCIVNIHGAHLEGLGTIEGVARAKEELFEKTSAKGILVVNLDDAHVVLAAGKYKQEKIYYSAEQGREEADLWAEDISIAQNGLIRFLLAVGDEKMLVQLQVPGLHNVSNGLAAAAIAHGAGIDIRIIAEGLESFRAADKRMQVIQTTAGYTILNDTYNANPASMLAGIQTLASMAGGKKIAILGDMLELGTTSNDAHLEIGRKAAVAGIDYLVVLGSFAEYIARGALLAGFDRERVMIFQNKSDVVSWMTTMQQNGMVQPSDWVLVKASRGMKLESIVELLVAL